MQNGEWRMFSPIVPRTHFAFFILHFSFYILPVAAAEPPGKLLGLSCWKLTLPEAARLPPLFTKTLRTLATVRVGLSVAASTMMATPCGP